MGIEVKSWPGPWRPTLDLRELPVDRCARMVSVEYLRLANLLMVRGSVMAGFAAGSPCGPDLGGGAWRRGPELPVARLKRQPMEVL